MGGPSKQATAQQNQITQQELGLSQNLQNAGLSTLSSGTSNLNQVANYDTSVINAANSGNYSQLIGASGAQIGNINQQAAGAKSNILQNIPAGPGRDAALANLPAQTGNAVASTLNSTYNNALQQLAGIGTTQAGIGLQGAGGGISALGGASSSNQAYAQQTAAASPWNIVASLAGGVGQAASGTNFKSGGAGGGAGAGASVAADGGAAIGQGLIA